MIDQLPARTFTAPIDIVRVDRQADGNGKVTFDLHPGQVEAWNAKERFILILAGLQSGKTAFGPIWLYREIWERGPGDYLVGSPTFPLLELKALPEFKRLFINLLGWGEYVGSPVRVFTFNRRAEIAMWGAPQRIPTRVLFAHATDPESLESATYKGAWLDEAGQKKFPRGSWIAVRGRLSLEQGRALLTTTPYTLGWMKSELYDPWIRSGRNHPSIRVINFPSTMNPRFPVQEFEEMRKVLPLWLFNMRYRGLFERPAGMIYDCFSERENTCPRFAIPDTWRRSLGLDFGGNNTAGVYLAAEQDSGGNPTGRFFAYRTYLEGSRTAKDHAAHMIAGEPRTPEAVGGSASEGQWRNEFAEGGLGVWKPPISDVEVGIQRVYELFKTRRLIIFNDLRDLIDQATDYSRVLGPDGEPTEKIEDKETYHLLDALRYIGSWINTFGEGDLMR